MKAYLQNLVEDLKKFSKSLDKKSIIIDKPWALIDSGLEIQKLIFKKNNELIMSKEGQVSVGRWEYLSEAKSILIDRGTDKVLFNEGFIDDAIMILKRDGIKNEFIVLANENQIPDLDAFKYIKHLWCKHIGISTKILSDGRALEINPHNLSVSIDFNAVPDGEYKLNNSIVRYSIKNSQIVRTVYEKSYKTKDGQIIIIEQNTLGGYFGGELVRIGQNIAPDGKYRIVESNNIIVKDGKIAKKLFF